MRHLGQEVALQVHARALYLDFLVPAYEVVHPADRKHRDYQHDDRNQPDDALHALEGLLSGSRNGDGHDDVAALAVGEALQKPRVALEAHEELSFRAVFQGRSQRVHHSLINVLLFEDLHDVVAFEALVGLGIRRPQQDHAVLVHDIRCSLAVEDGEDGHVGVLLGIHHFQKARDGHAVDDDAFDGCREHPEIAFALHGAELGFHVFPGMDVLGEHGARYDDGLPFKRQAPPVLGKQVRLVRVAEEALHLLHGDRAGVREETRRHFGVLLVALLEQLELLRDQAADLLHGLDTLLVDRLVEVAVRSREGENRDQQHRQEQPAYRFEPDGGLRQRRAVFPLRHPRGPSRVSSSGSGS